jgi:hypothetical protein
MTIVYKFVELSVVTDETIEEAVNTWVKDGWQWDGIRFVVTEGSRRPGMAFVSFVREAADGPAGDPSAPRKPRLVTD